MSVTAILAGGVLLSATVARAQQAEPTVSPEPAAPAADATKLPEVVVDTTAEQQKAPKKKAKAKVKAASSAQSTGTPATETQTGTTGRGAESATGPVKNYNATRTATGTKTDTPLKEIPQSISVVGAEQIRDMGAQSEQQVLRYLPGVVADSYGNDGRADGSFIRGIDATEYLDGMRRTFNYYTSTYRIDPYFMERIEVLRGPASVLFGQAAVGGIINSVSKLPQNEQGGEVTVEYGTFDFKQVKFDTTGQLSSDGKWTYRLTGLARDADTQVDYVEDDRYAIQPALTFRPDSATSITVLGHFQKDHSGSISQFFPHIGTIFPNVSGQHIAQDRFVGEPGDHYDTDVASGTLLIDHRFNEVFKLHHSSSYTDVHNDYASTYSGHFYAWDPDIFPHYPYLDPDQTKMARYKFIGVTDTQVFSQDTNLEAKFATGILSHKVLGGVDYTNFKTRSVSGGALNVNPSYPFDVYNPVYGTPEMLWGNTCDENPEDIPPHVLPEIDVCRSPDQRITQTGLYAQDQMRLGNWIAIVGVRKDWIENANEGSATQKDDAISYRAGLMYELAFGLTPYVSYGESFIPVVGQTSPARGSEAFDPQQGRMYELGFKYQPSGANFAINGAVYDIAENNHLETDSSDIRYSVQSGAISSRGFELELVGQVTRNLKVAGGYSYTEAEYDGDDPLAGNQIESVPKHMASLWGVWEFDEPQLKGWSVGGGVRYIGKSWDATNTLAVPDVTLFDAMVAYEEDHWRWQVTGQNLEDEEVITTCLSRGDCFLGQARTIITSLTYKY